MAEPKQPLEATLESNRADTVNTGSAGSGTIVVADRPGDVRQRLIAARPQIESALPRSFEGGVERFERIVLTAVRLVPDLTACTPNSVLGAVMQAAQLGLEPGLLGHAWILPYRNRDSGQLEAQFQVGWKGMLELARRSGFILAGHEVQERDVFTYTLGLEPSIVHEPAKGDRGPAVAWYAYARERGTGTLAGFAVLDKASVERRRKASKSANGPAWRDWYREMALSKAARECCRFLPLTVESAVALASDGTVRNVLSGTPEEYPGDDYAALAAGEVE